jgi:predicted nucleotidyltransferase
MINLSERRQQALAIADKCMQVLKEDFGAEKVILFGSLRGDGPWHEKSDLDLAVEGLSEQGFWDAYGALEKLMPDWLLFDLIPLAKTPDYLRDRILQKTPMPTNPYLALKVRIEEEMVAMEEIVKTLAELVVQSRNVPQAFVTPTLAGYIVDFFTSCERISERVAVSLDGGLPKGDGWHQQLLWQMTNRELKHRPVLCPKELGQILDDYRKFRHVARHVYNTKLDPARVMILAEAIASVEVQVKSALQSFNQWLVQKAEEN